MGREFRLRDRPIIANQLVKISYALMFYAEAAVLVFATILMIVFFKEVGLGKRPRGEVAPARASQAAESAAGNAVEHAVKQTGESQRPQRFSVWRSYRRACADGALMSMVVLMFLYTLAYYQIVSGLPISMTQIGLGTDEYSSLLTINGGLLCLLQIPAIGLFQRMSNTRVLVLGMSITAVGYAFQIGANSWVTFGNRDRAVDAWRAGHVPDCRHNGGEHRAKGCARHLPRVIQPGVVAVERVLAVGRRLDSQRVRQPCAVDLLHGDVHHRGDRLLRDARPTRTRRRPQSRC